MVQARRGDEAKFQWVLRKNPFEDWFIEDNRERFDGLSLWSVIRKYHTKGGLVTCAIAAGGERCDESLGIVAGHANSVLRVMELKKQDKMRLLQLCNPWGTFSWNGRWSRQLRQWKQFGCASKLGHREV